MKILVAYTGRTELSKAVLSLAKKNARLLNAELHIVNSKENPPDKEVINFIEFEKELESLKDSIVQEGIQCETHVMITGRSPGDDIIEFAKDKKIDQIYIGIEKKSKVGKLIFGSNAQLIILEAPCPVISVNKEALPNLQV